ncbi:MAG: RNA polymerase sporulation sigma factor SigK [Eubacterium sp.]
MLFLKTFMEPLTQSEEDYYLEQLKAGDKKARDILIERNLRLVAHIVKKYNQDERETEDFISIGTIGLIKAINTYDTNKGNRLATYAARCIENEILMMFRNEKKRNRDVSLHEPIGTDKEGNTISLLDIIESESEGMTDKLELQENISRLYQIMPKVLNKRELEIIIKRYGLEKNEAVTQKEIGDELGISRSYVSRIEKRALEKLKKAFDSTNKV